MEPRGHFRVCLIPVMMLIVAGGSYVTAGMDASYFIREVLLKNYDPSVRPLTASSEPVMVNMSIGIRNIIDLNMKAQTLVAFGWLYVTWYDSSLAWNLGQYPIKRVYLAPHRVWRPELVIFNTMGSLDQMQCQQLHVTVTHDGKVSWSPGGVLETLCTVNILKFPLDTQVCSVEVVFWAPERDDLRGTFDEPVFDVSLMKQHPEWKLVHTDAVYVPTPNEVGSYCFKFTIKRKAAYHVLFLFLPVVLLSLVNCLVFLLPSDCGEKVTLGITALVSTVVVMSQIGNTLPENSDGICIFSIYLTLQLALCVASNVMAAVIIHVFGQNWQLSLTTHQNEDEQKEHVPDPLHNARRRSTISGVPGLTRRLSYVSEVLGSLPIREEHEHSSERHGDGTNCTVPSINVEHVHSSGRRDSRDNLSTIPEEPEHVHSSGRRGSRDNMFTIPEEPEHPCERHGDRPRHTGAVHVHTCRPWRWSAVHDWGSLCTSWTTATRLVKRVGSLNAIERGVLAQALDSICFALSLTTTVSLFLIVLFLMLFL